MKDAPSSTKEFIRWAIDSETFAVLSTEGGGQPHTSLIAVTVYNEISSLLFATYKATRKYENITDNKRVAILFDNRSSEIKSSKDITVITAFGFANELNSNVHSKATKTHLLKHPDLKDFLESPECTLFEVKVDAYQIVKGIESVEWLNIADL